MKKLFFLIIICLLSTGIYSQTSAIERFSTVKDIPTPYVDKTDIKINQNSIQLTESDWLLYQFNKLEEFDADFQYNVYGTIVVDTSDIDITDPIYDDFWIAYYFQVVYHTEKSIR